MTSRFEKERAKQIQDKCQDLLTQMLRDEDNKYCVDCDAKGTYIREYEFQVHTLLLHAAVYTLKKNNSSDKIPQVHGLLSEL